jgi:hypothetical protein
MSIGARAFVVADDEGGFIRNGTPTFHFVAMRMPKLCRTGRPMLASGEGSGMAPRVARGAWRQQDARRIVGTNNLSTSSDKQRRHPEGQEGQSRASLRPYRGAAERDVPLTQRAAR